MEIGKILEVTPLRSYYKVIESFKKAFEGLCLSVPETLIEELAHTVVDSMSGAYRQYHRTDHILELANQMDSLGILAALYHDIVYVQVDGGLPSAVQSMISKYFSLVNGVIYTTDIEGDDLYDMALMVFAFEKGQKLLPQNGQNEFLSALVAINELKAQLLPKDLLAITCCIEATIPFRGKKNPMENLKDRIESLSVKLHLSITKKEQTSIIQRAALLANKDVGNFAYDDVRGFLENTWKLLPENNLRLADSAYFTTREYRIAIQKMLGFLLSLDHKSIYYQYESIPSDEEMNKLFSQAAKNLKIGHQYLKVKLYVIFLLEALAHLTGGDVPLIYMIGDVNEKKSDQNILMHHFLSKPNGPITTDCHPALLDLFEKTPVANLISLDEETSSVCLFIYQIIGDTGINRFYENFKQFVDGSLSYKDLLDKEPASIVKAFALACGNIAKVRQKLLQKI